MGANQFQFAGTTPKPRPGTMTRQKSMSGPDGYGEVNTFDALGRPSRTTITIPSDTTYQVDYAYQAQTGYLDTVEYPQSIGTRLKGKRHAEAALTIMV